ncbi:MAG: hypothetical protein NUV63_13790 [Gallionella sp.]|nr:hypothetical protein [Gallionella sp.]
MANTVFELKPATGYALLVFSSRSRKAPAYGLGVQVTDGDAKPKILRIPYDRHTGGDSIMPATLSAVMVTVGTAF